MAGTVDHEQVLADFEAYLLADGRTSHGTPQLLRKLAELRAARRVDEHAEQATLRRFGGRMTDVFFGLLPDPGTTDAPLSPTDPQDGAGDERRRAHPIP